MMLKIEFREQHQQGKPDIFCPVFYCDWCGEKIEREQEGLYQFWTNLEGYPMKDTLVTTHRIVKQCNHEWEEATREEGYLHGWMHLRHLMGYLVNNLEIDWSKFVAEFKPPGKIRTGKRKIEQPGRRN